MSEKPLTFAEYSKRILKPRAEEERAEKYQRQMAEIAELTRMAFLPIYAVKKLLHEK